MPEFKSARDNPGTFREYECVLILRPDTLQEGILEINNKIKGLVGENGGKIILIENWGKRRLAYEIRKQLKGIYLYYQLLGNGPMVNEMERQFRFSEAIIRYFTLRLDENVDPAARPSELTDEDFLAASATRPDEEELATGYVMTGSGEKIPVSKLGYQGGEERAERKPAEQKASAETPPAEAPQSETAEAPQSETAEAPQSETAEAPQSETAEAPQSETAEAPQSETAESAEASQGAKTDAETDAETQTADETPEPRPETDGDDSKGA